jgi:sterol desaturase/sphingolipid hydroxylase (fatty acid hydroxylase superfamily)
MDDFLINLFKDYIYYPTTNLFHNVVFTWGFVAALVFTLIMERLFPVNPNQKTFSLSFFHDFIWFFYENILHLLIINTYIHWLAGIYHGHFEFLTIESAGQWPYWVRFVCGVLLLDFCYWLQHYILHKVPWFWYFHMVHHSQREISFFTDYRYHFLEYIVRETILSIPFLILQVNTPTIVWFSFLRRWYTRFYHGNIKTNLGPLRYILVTPQSHRVHHSMDQKHYDKNFGSLFTFWDFIFGTQYKGFEEYPVTGVHDKTFPHEKSLNVFSLILTPIHQMVYPFRRIWQDIVQKFSRK